MNKKLLLILLYVAIVGASLFVVYSLYRRLTAPAGDTVLNYALLIGFLLFTYINFKRLLKLIRDYKQ